MIFNFCKVCNIAFCEEINGEEDFFRIMNKNADIYIFKAKGATIKIELNEKKHLLENGDFFATKNMQLMQAGKNGCCNETYESEIAQQNNGARCATNDINAIVIGLTGIVPSEAAKSGSLPIVINAQNSCSHALNAAFENIENATNENAAPHFKSECAYGLLCALECAFEEQEESESENVPLVNQAVSEIHKNYSGIYGVEELSDYLGVSKNHLVRVFSAKIGEPPGKYLTKIRINAAKQMLLNRDYSLDIVAAMCGFSGANYFCKVFKKYEGISPTQYRARNSDAKNKKDSVENDVHKLEQALYV